MTADKRERRRWKRSEEPPQKEATDSRQPVRLAPTSDPAEAVERLVPRRQLLIEDGDVIVLREPAGVSRAAGLSAVPSGSQFRLSVRGAVDDRPRLFASYDRAIMDAEALAARRRVRLFYVEDGALTLLKDYRPTASQ